MTRRSGRYTQVDALLQDGPPSPSGGCGGGCALLAYVYAGNAPTVAVYPSGLYMFAPSCNATDRENINKAVTHLRAARACYQCGDWKIIDEWLGKSNTMIGCDRNDPKPGRCGYVPREEGQDPHDWSIWLSQNALDRKPFCGCLAGVIGHELGHAASGKSSSDHDWLRERKRCVCLAGAF